MEYKWSVLVWPWTASLLHWPSIDDYSLLRPAEKLASIWRSWPACSVPQILNNYSSYYHDAWSNRSYQWCHGPAESAMSKSRVELPTATSLPQRCTVITARHSLTATTFSIKISIANSDNAGDRNVNTPIQCCSANAAIAHCRQRFHAAQHNDRVSVPNQL